MIERCNKHGTEYRVEDGCPACKAGAIREAEVVFVRAAAKDSDKFPVNPAYKIWQEQP